MSASSRREFLRWATVVGAAGCLPARPLAGRVFMDDAPLFRISLAQWSIHRMIFDHGFDPMEFPRFAKERFDLDAVEHVNQCYTRRYSDFARRQVVELKKRADDAGVKSLLIMIDGEGDLGEADAARRRAVVENHVKWLEAAKALGCHSIRVNAASTGTPDEQRQRAADGLRSLCERADLLGINVIVENHGRLSSDGAWLASVIRAVGHPRCGTLPDFGNFLVQSTKESTDGKEVWYDRYQGVAELMPFAKAVSAKSHEFDAAGNETRTDYRRMLKIVIDAGYRGHVGIEYEGDGLSEIEGVTATKALLERVREEVAGAMTTR